jgi:hypothetical protein
MKYKNGKVDINKTKPEAFEIMVAAREAFGFFGANAIITSGQDGKHGKGSLHGAGYAPLIKGIDTYFITGNHDESFKRAAGINVGELLQDIRSDWHFLGEGKGGRIVLSADNGVSADIMMMHPRGNPPYALSYRLQKIIESLEGGNKPQLLITGHYHKSEILPTYRNVCGLQSGCFQWQTPFLAELGSPAHVGGWIIEVTPQTKTNGNIFKMQFVAFYNTKK